jgi:hypothetical protein
MTTDPSIDGKLIIVTGGDAKYFALLAEQLASIRRLPQGKDLPFAVLDGGLEAGQVTALEDNGARIVRPQWPSAGAERRARGRDFLRINLNKPNLDQLFPEYEVILWLDGDTWLQTWDAVALFAMVAAKGKLAIVSQASRLQKTHLALRRRWFGWVEPRGILFKNARRARLPAKIAWSLVDRPVLNTGAFALRCDAPHWAAWRTWQQRCLAHGRAFTSDQLALALAVYQDGLPHEALPETCNYMGPWRLDRARGLLVHHFAPYDALSVVHLAAEDAMRSDASVTVPGQDMDDGPVDLALRFSTFQATFGTGSPD